VAGLPGADDPPGDTFDAVGISYRRSTVFLHD
jgi:hypothetical protein